MTSSKFFPCLQCGRRTPSFVSFVGQSVSNRTISSSSFLSVHLSQTIHSFSNRRRAVLMRAASDDVAGKARKKKSDEKIPIPSSIPVRSDGAKESKKSARFKVQRRIATGIVMGIVVIAFVFSGKWTFLAGVLLVSLLGQGEYYRMVAAKGHLPAPKMGLCVTAATMISGALAPAFADVAFPLGGTLVCIYLLFRQNKIATIADISTTFMGLFYAGYLPSYWVRLHEYKGASVPAMITTFFGRVWPSFLHFQPVVTVGSLLVFWTWLAVASADIGAFFVGRTYGRTRFSDISPKKTVEGAVAGFVCSASVSILGAFLLRWPIWWATGALYGFTVGVVGLFGDLFTSCFKRDVGWKDSGSLFPGHGGILDRADSYVLIAPLVYFFATLVLPVISAMVS